MAKWQDEYRVGEHVEYQLIMADGRRWSPAYIMRKTATGRPVVQVLDGATPVPGQTYVVERKDTIRKLTAATCADGADDRIDPYLANYIRQLHKLLGSARIRCVLDRLDAEERRS